MIHQRKVDYGAGRDVSPRGALEGEKLAPGELSASTVEGCISLRTLNHSIVPRHANMRNEGTMAMIILHRFLEVESSMH